MVEHNVTLMDKSTFTVYFPEVKIFTNRQKSGYTSRGDVLYTCDKETIMGNVAYCWYTLKENKIYQHAYIVADQTKHIVDATELFLGDDFMKPFLQKHHELKAVETEIHEVFIVYHLSGNKYLEKNKLTF